MEMRVPGGERWWEMVEMTPHEFSWTSHLLLLFGLLLSIGGSSGMLCRQKNKHTWRDARVQCVEAYETVGVNAQRVVAMRIGTRRTSFLDVSHHIDLLLESELHGSVGLGAATIAMTPMVGRIAC